MSEGEKKVAIALPFEWAIQKVLGPTCESLGIDLEKLYVRGRDKLIAAAYRKIENPEDGKKSNLRITHDVMTSGVFTDDQLSAEYFGGILAASRSNDGKKDDAIHFVEVIKSMSARQLHLHYVIYNCLNKRLASSIERVNVAQGAEIQRKEIWFSAIELSNRLGLKVDTDLNILNRLGLINQYSTSVNKIDEEFVIPVAMVKPTTFGILLYAFAHNFEEKWRTFDAVDFGDFPDILLPTLYFSSFEQLALSQSKAPERIIAANE